MINKIFAAIVFTFCFFIYLATMAQSASFWDSGEFIAVSYNLGVTHPSGAPLYILIGNFFTSLFFFISDVGARVNLLSVFCSAFSVTLLYLIIVHLITSWYKTKSKVEPLSIYFSAMTGSLLFAFTDSQWFNAVESEVYAMSMLSTALVVWLTLKWTENRGSDGNSKYILLIAYVFGLSIGVHPLNLLALPFVILTIYFSHTKDSFWGFLIDNFMTYIFGSIVCAIFVVAGVNLTMSIAFSILIISLYLIIKFIVITSNSPNLQKNNFIYLFLRRVSIPIISLLIFAIAYKGILMGFTGFVDQIADYQNFLKFYDSSSNEITGWKRISKIVEMVIFPVLIFSLVLIGLFLSFKSIIKNNLIKILSISVLLFYIGYSTYASIVIRAHKNPTINMNSPSTAERFKEYIYREQYGDLVPIDLWGILKYYLGGDNSTETEIANFRTKQYLSSKEPEEILSSKELEEILSSKESDETKNKTVLSIEGKASKLSSLPSMGKAPIDIIAEEFNKISSIPNARLEILEPELKQGILDINNFIDSTNFNPITKSCGTLMTLDLDDIRNGSPSLENIIFVSNNFEIEKLQYLNTDENDIYHGCDLDEGYLFLSDDGNIYYNSLTDTIIGFKFDLDNVPIKKIGSKRIDYTSLLNSPNNIRWIPKYQDNIPKHELSNILSNENIMDFIINYQINEMYFRYFGWQFIGREYNRDNFSYTLATKNTSPESMNTNDYETLSTLQRKESNNSFVNFKSNVDWSRYGIPFALIFGIIGMIYHFIRDPKNAFSIFVLFIVTGLLILFYINQTDPQPRERDYAYVGSFFSFSIWIGIGCMSFFEFGLKILKHFNLNTRYNLLMFIIPLFCILFGVMPINYLVNDFKVHNRAGNFAARDFGFNHIISCKPNSVLITIGDNDTYPLWFNQGTDPIRDSIRVANLSLMNAPWYIEQIYNNNDPGTIKFNFDEPFLSENEYLKLAEFSNEEELRFPGRKGYYDKGEEFFDLGNGLYDEGEEFEDLNSNQKWDEGEEFIDLGNGLYDEGEEFEDSKDIYIKSAIKNGWYIDINKNQKHDKYDSEKIIKSLKDDPLSNNMNAFAITIHAIKRWDPVAWEEVEKNYFKFELYRALFDGNSKFLEFINLNEETISSSRLTAGDKSISYIEGLEKFSKHTFNTIFNNDEYKWVIEDYPYIKAEFKKNIIDEIFKLYQNSYSTYIKQYVSSNGAYDYGEEFIDCNESRSICQGDKKWEPELGNGKWDEGEEFKDLGNGYYRDHYNVPKNLKIIWGKDLDEEGSTYIFPVADFLPIEGFRPIISYKNEIINLQVSSIIDNGQITLQEFMILKILEDLEPNRSLYFTSSVPTRDHVGLKDYLEYQGLVSEVLKPSDINENFEMNGKFYLNSGAKYINRKIFKENIFNNYVFENMNNPEVHYSPNNLKHLQEYWHIFLAYLNEHRFVKISENEKPDDCSGELREELKEINEFFPHELIKMQEFMIEEPIKEVYLLNLFYAAKMEEEYKDMMDRLIDSNNSQMSFKSYLYILEMMPPDNYLLDYKKKKIIDILNKLDRESTYRVMRAVDLRSREGNVAGYHNEYLSEDGTMMFDKNCNGRIDNINIDFAKYIALEAAKKLESKESILSELNILESSLRDAQEQNDVEGLKRAYDNLADYYSNVIFPRHSFVHFLFINSDEQPTYENFTNFVKNLY